MQAVPLVQARGAVADRRDAAAAAAAQRAALPLPAADRALGAAVAALAHPALLQRQRRGCGSLHAPELGQATCSMSPAASQTAPCRPSLTLRFTVSMRAVRSSHNPINCNASKIGCNAQR